MTKILLVFLLFFCHQVNAQIFKKDTEDNKERRGIRLPKYVATKESIGMIGGIERGQYTFMELGIERHWKKVRLVHARTIAANGNLEYNFGNNILGYNAGAWIKTGRVDLTYGFNLNYITDFEHERYGLGPQIGFRLLGLHFVNGYNFLWGDKELDKVNKFYVGLRYYFPLRSKTKVENINKRKPSEKSKKDDDTKKSFLNLKPEKNKSENKKSEKSKGKSKSKSSKKNKNKSEKESKGLFGRDKKSQSTKDKKGKSSKENKEESKKDTRRKPHWLFKD